MDFLILAFIIPIIIIGFLSIKIVPQQEVWIVERLGKFHNAMEAGLHIIIPFVDKISYNHSLKEQAIDVTEQTAITRDNVTLMIDGILYVKIINPQAASYGVHDPYYAIIQLAQTTMRSEIGKMTLDRTFEERESMNSNIVLAINHAALDWGIQCMRYEIKDIKPPASVLKAMELEIAADRQKRALILESEGKRQSQINIAEGDKQEIVLRSEGALLDQVNRAKGEAEAINMITLVTANNIKTVAESLKDQNGIEAAHLKLANDYIAAFSKLAKESNSLIIPSNVSDIGSIIAQATNIFNHQHNIERKKKKSDI